MVIFYISFDITYVTQISNNVNHIAVCLLTFKLKPMNLTMDFKHPSCDAPYIVLDQLL